MFSTLSTVGDEGVRGERRDGRYHDLISSRSITRHLPEVSSTFDFDWTSGRASSLAEDKSARLREMLRV